MNRLKKPFASLLASTMIGTSMPWPAYAKSVRIAQPTMIQPQGLTGLIPQLPLTLSPSAAAAQPNLALPAISLQQAPAPIARPQSMPSIAGGEVKATAQTEIPKQTANDALFDGTLARDGKESATAVVAPSEPASKLMSLTVPSDAAAGREALRKWVLKSVLQFGFEKDVQEANKIIDRLSASKETDRWDAYKLSPSETLTFSSPDDGKELVIEFTRDNGRGHKPTVISGHYNGTSGYSLTLQFPQMGHQLVMTQDKKIKSDQAVSKLSDAEFAAWLTKEEGLDGVDSLAQRQLDQPDFKAWEQFKDKWGQYPVFSPRATLLGEITTSELYHLLDWNGFQQQYRRQGKVRLDIVYGYIGDEKLGEPDPIDLEQAREVVSKLKQKGYKLSGSVLSKEFSYKGKPVTIEVRVTPAALSNVPLTNRISEILDHAGISKHQRILQNILGKGKASPWMFPEGPSAQWLTDTINNEIENFERLQMSSSFKAKRAFAESLAKADVVVYDGHSGAGYGFRFGPINIFLDRFFTFAFGKLRLYIDKQIKKISNIGFVQRFLRKLPWNEGDGYFYLELFTVPWLSGKALTELAIDPMRQRQLLFFDACRTLFLYDKPWRRLMQTYQRLRAPEQFDMIGTTNDSNTGDGVAAKLNMVDAIEKGMNAKQIIDHLRSGAVDGTKYAPGELMGVADGTYDDIFREPENKSHPSNTPDPDSPGFIINNNGAQVSFFKPSDRQQSFPYWVLQSAPHKKNGASK